MDFTTIYLLTNNVKTGWIILDLGIILATLILTNKISISKIKETFSSFKKFWSPPKGSIILESIEKKSSQCYADSVNDYTWSMLSLLHLCNKNKNISNQLETTKSGSRSGDEDNLFVPNNGEIVNLAESIYCKFTRTIQELSNTKSSDYHEITVVQAELYSNTKSCCELKKFLKKCERAYKRYIEYENDKSIKYFLTNKPAERIQRITFREYLFNSNKTFDNVFF